MNETQINQVTKRKFLVRTGEKIAKDAGRIIYGVGGLITRLLAAPIIGSCGEKTRERIYEEEIGLSSGDVARISIFTNSLVGLFSIGYGVNHKSWPVISSGAYLILESFIRSRVGDWHGYDHIPGSIIGSPISTGYGLKDYCAEKYKETKEEFIQKDI